MWIYYIQYVQGTKLSYFLEYRILLEIKVEILINLITIYTNKEDFEKGYNTFQWKYVVMITNNFKFNAGFRKSIVTQISDTSF